MYQQAKTYFLIITCMFVMVFVSCNENKSNETAHKDHIVTDPKKMDDNVRVEIEATLTALNNSNGIIDDSTQLKMAGFVSNFYSDNKFSPVWSKKEKWSVIADSIYDLISNARLHGLFPEDYHFQQLFLLKKSLEKDSLLRMKADVWAKADLMLTDGMLKMMKDFKYGRLQDDSIARQKDSILGADFYIGNLKKIIEKKQYTAVINSIQPGHKGYWELKNGLKAFLDSTDNKTYTYVSYPYKKRSSKDSLAFISTLKKRLNESGCLDSAAKASGELTASIKKFQKQKGLVVDGKITTALIKAMNSSDAEKFNNIAITLDRYKLLPDNMPEKYIWVNLPGFYLQVWDHEEVALYSKVICGRPTTRTPLLTSRISDMITYPTWTVPTSIIVKQYLPKLRNNPNYLSRIGLKLINSKGERIDGSTVNWSKYSKGIPYNVMQGSGDNNALGVIKFNFDNPFSVYLHDTNQRYLFKNDYRALSHGCVRVQEWEKLAAYIAQNDSLSARNANNMEYNADSISNWIAKKSHRRIVVKNQLPLYIQYFTCVGKAGKIQFYNDIYGEDKLLREKYFANK